MKNRSLLCNKLILFSLMTQSTSLLCMQPSYKSQDDRTSARLERRRQKQLAEEQEKKAKQDAQKEQVKTTQTTTTAEIQQPEQVQEEKETTIDQQPSVEEAKIAEKVEVSQPVVVNNSIKKNKLIESRIITPTPTKKIYPYSSFTLNKERDNLIADLEANTFDIDNLEYHIIINRAMNDFVDYNEHEKLVKTLRLVRQKYCGKIKPEDIPTGKSHEYLTKTHKEKLETLKTKSTELNKDHIVKLNALLAAMQKDLISYVTDANDIMKKYQKELQEKIEAAGDDIRENKKALLCIHQLNRTFVLGKDGYCSDEEDNHFRPGHKCVKDSDNITEFYNDVHILQKIGVEHKTKNTGVKIATRLSVLAEINKQTQTLPTLTYIDDKKNKHVS